MALPCSVPWVTRLEFGAQARQIFAEPAQQWRSRIERVLRIRRGQSRSAKFYGVEGGPNALRELLGAWPASAAQIAGHLEDAIHRADPRLRAEVRLPQHMADAQVDDKVHFEVCVHIDGQEGGYLFEIELDGRGRIGVNLGEPLQ